MPATRGWSGPDRRQLSLRIVGAGLLLATGAVHLDLYLTGYRTIPTIGWLFLLQLITAFALGLGLLASRSRLLAAAGAVFALATLGGYLLSLRVGLFGFREVRTTAGIAAGVIEVVDLRRAGRLRPRPPCTAPGRWAGERWPRARSLGCGRPSRPLGGEPSRSRCWPQCCWGSRWRRRDRCQRAPEPRGRC